MPHDTLNVLNRPLLLCEGCNRSADHPERQLGQVEFTSDLVKDAPAKVVCVEEVSIFVLEDENLRRQRSGLSLALGECLLELFFTLQTPCRQLICEPSRNVNHGEALLRFSPVSDFALIDSLRDRERRCPVVESLPSQSEELGRKAFVISRFKQDAIPKTQPFVIFYAKRAAGMIRLGFSLHPHSAAESSFRLLHPAPSPSDDRQGSH